MGFTFQILAISLIGMVAFSAFGFGLAQLRRFRHLGLGSEGRADRDLGGEKAVTGTERTKLHGHDPSRKVGVGQSADGAPPPEGQRELETLEGENRRLEGEVERLTRELAATQRKAQQTEGLEQRLGELQTAQSAARSRVRDVEALLDREATAHRETRARLEEALRVANAKTEESRRLLAELSERRARESAAVSSARSAEERLDVERKRGVLLRTESESLRDARMKAEAEVQSLTRAIADLEKERGGLKDLSLRLHVAEAKTEQVEDLRAVGDRLLARVHELEADSVPRTELEAAQQRIRSLLIHEQVLTSRVSSLEAAASENVALKEQLRLAQDSDKDIATLSARIKELESQVFAADLPTATHLAWTGAQAQAASAHRALDDAPLSEAVDTLLERLVSSGAAKVAVLADDSGLVVGGAGDAQYFEALAGIAGLMETVGERARSMLPLGAIHAVTISDVNAVGVRANLFRCADQLLGLTTLGNVEEEHHEEVEVVRASLTGVFERDETLRLVPGPGVDGAR